MRVFCTSKISSLFRWSCVFVCSSTTQTGPTHKHSPPTESGKNTNDNYRSENLLFGFFFFLLKSGDGNSTHSLNLWLMLPRIKTIIALRRTLIKKKKKNKTLTIIFFSVVPHSRVLVIGMCWCGGYYCFWFHSPLRPTFVGWWQKNTALSSCIYIMLSFLRTCTCIYLFNGNE